MQGSVDFPEGMGANSRKGCANLLFANSFAENRMKMKEIEPKVGVERTSLASPWIRY